MPNNTMNTEANKQPQGGAAPLIDYELERRVLSDCTLGNRFLAKQRAGGITEDCFTMPTFKRLFCRLCELDREGVDFSPANLYSELGQPLLDALGGYAGVLSMQADYQNTRDIPGALDVDRERLLGLARKRKKRDATYAYGQALERGVGVEAARRNLQELEETEAEGNRTGAMTGAEMAKLGYDAWIEATQNDGITGVRTGFQTLDELTGGLQEGHYCIVGARPSVGKTAFALNIALAVAKAGKRVLFLTAEMSVKRLSQRLIGILGQVNKRDFFSTDAEKVNQAGASTATGYKILKTLPVAILDVCGWNVEQVADAVRLEHRRAPLGLVVVDYLGLLKCDTLPAQATQFDTVTEVTKSLCRIAKKNNVPLLALCQLSRGAGKDEPTLTDLRQSGQIEQDADMVLLLDRPEKRMPAGAERDKVKGEARLIVAKNRDGEADKIIPMRFTGETYTFQETERSTASG